MIKIWMLSCSFLLFCLVGCEENVSLETSVQKQSYSYGMAIGKDLVERNVDLNVVALVAGLNDAINDTAELSDEDMQAALKELENTMREKYLAEMAEKRVENLEKSETFLNENKSKDGVVELASGLQYRIIEPGSGKSPTEEDVVVVHYAGTLIDGTEFDSSYSRNEPVEFQVTQVIPGWTEALMLMEEGAKWELFIPPNLAYGQNGAGPLIGPNEALIFEVEFLSIK